MAGLGPISHVTLEAEILKNNELMTILTHKMCRMKYWIYVNCCIYKGELSYSPITIFLQSFTKHLRLICEIE